MKFLAALSLKAKIIAGAVAVATAAGTAAVVIVLSAMPEAFRLLKIFEMTGTSVVTRADAGAIDAYTGMNLESGDIIEVGENSTMTLSLDSDKYLSLDPSTVLELIAEGTEEDSKTTVNLKSGGVLNEITEPLSAESSYSVNTPKATMAVRGTSFYISVQVLDDGSYITDVSVFHGKVEVQLIDEEGSPRGEPVIVQPNESVAILTVPSEGNISGAEINGTSCFILRKSDGSDTFALVGDGESPIMPLNINIIPDRVIDRIINTHDRTDIVLSEAVLASLLGDDTYSANSETTSQISADETSTTTLSETSVETTVPETTTETSVETTVPENAVTEETVIPSEMTTVPETTVTTAVSKRDKEAAVTTAPETTSKKKNTTVDTTVTAKKETTTAKTTVKQKPSTTKTTQATTTVPSGAGNIIIVDPVTTTATTAGSRPALVSGSAVPSVTTTVPVTGETEIFTTTTEAEPVYYTVNFISNPGGITVAAPQTVEEGGYAEEPTEYSASIHIDGEEYTFWDFESPFGPITADTDVLVKYVKVTTVFSVYVTDNGTTTLVGTYDEGETFALPQPAGKENAVFKYWGHRGVTSGGALRERGQYQPGASLTASHDNAYEFESDSDTNIRFEAVYEDKTPATITYVYNGTTYKTVNAYVGDSLIVPGFTAEDAAAAGIPDGTSYTFNGYRYGNNQSCTIGDIITIEGDLTLNADIAISVTVTFLDHADNVIGTRTGNAGSAIDIPTAPARNGYSFTGWIRVDNGASFDGNIPADATTDFSVKADYLGDLVTITFTYNGNTYATYSGDLYRVGEEFTFPEFDYEAAGVSPDSYSYVEYVYAVGDLGKSYLPGRTITLSASRTYEVGLLP